MRSSASRLEPATRMRNGCQTRVRDLQVYNFNVARTQWINISLGYTITLVLFIFPINLLGTRQAWRTLYHPDTLGFSKSPRTNQYSFHFTSFTRLDWSYRHLRLCQLKFQFLQSMNHITITFCARIIESNMYSFLTEGIRKYNIKHIITLVCMCDKL